LTEERLVNKENNMNPDLSKPYRYVNSGPQITSIPDKKLEFFEVRMRCFNCKQYSTVKFPKGTVVKYEHWPTPSYTLPNGTEGTVICGVCGAR